MLTYIHQGVLRIENLEQVTEITFSPSFRPRVRGRCKSGSVQI